MALAQVATQGPWTQIGAYDPGPPYFATGTSTYTSGTFDAAANSLLVLTVAVYGSDNATFSGVTNTGTALTWYRAVRRFSTAPALEHNTEVWYAQNTSAQTGITYTATWNEGTGNYTGHARGYLRVFTGHDTTTPISSTTSGKGAVSTAPWSPSALTTTTSCVVVGVFTDGYTNSTSNPMSSSTADSTSGVIQSASDHHTGFYLRGLSTSPPPGTHTPSLATVESTGFYMSGAFAVIAPSTGPTPGTSYSGIVRI